MAIPHEILCQTRHEAVMSLLLWASLNFRLQSFSLYMYLYSKHHAHRHHVRFHGADSGVAKALFCSNSLFSSYSASTRTLHNYQNSKIAFAFVTYGSSTNAWLCGWLTYAAYKSLLRRPLQVYCMPYLTLPDHRPLSTLLSTRNQVPSLLPPPICLVERRTDKHLLLPSSLWKGR